MPAARRYDLLYPQLMRQLPAPLSEPEMLAELSESARRFCEESKAWEQDLEPIDAVADQLDYALDVQWLASVHQIVRVGLRTEDEISDNANSRGAEIHPSRYEYVPNIETIRFASAPSATAITDGFLVTAVLVPHYDAPEIAEWFLDLHQHAIVAGAIESVCSRPDPKYANERVARRAGRSFRNGMAAAIQAATTKHTTRANQRTGGYGLL